MRKKQNFKVILFLLLGVIIVSCVDDYEPINNKIKNRETSNFKTTKITLKDVKQNSIAFSKLTNPKKDKSIGKLNHKIINDTINNFSIDTEIGTFIESDNYHSYTFKVIRPNGSAYLLENLVVSKEGTNDYALYFGSSSRFCSL
jgi:PBP1b-binding outer membrane lipoprotein LpoB